MEPTNEIKEYRNANPDGRKWAGVILLIVGGLIFIKQMGIVFFPGWLFSWPMILIVIGIFVGVKHKFRGPGWLIMLIIGGIFLWDREVDGVNLRPFLAPAIIIAIGLSMILRPRRRFYNKKNWGNNPMTPENAGTADAGWKADTIVSEEEYVNGSYFLGGTRKIITSKNFKGGSISCFMGGVEIDLTKADINGQAVLDISAVMGGAKIIIPSSWEIRNEIRPFLGGIDDKRQAQTLTINYNKLLILKGSAFMGGIEITNY
jgi:predicted membrane protein